MIQVVYHIIVQWSMPLFKERWRRYSLFSILRISIRLAVVGYCKNEGLFYNMVTLASEIIRGEMQVR